MNVSEKIETAALACADTLYVASHGDRSYVIQYTTEQCHRLLRDVWENTHTRRCPLSGTRWMINYDVRA